MDASSYIVGQYPRDVTMACAYFSKEVAQIHGSAPFANQTSRRKRCHIYSTDSSGCGRGSLGNRRRGRGRGYGRSNGRGRGGSGQSNRRELYYKNEQSMLFEKYTEMIIKCFSTLEKDEDEKLSDQQNVPT